MWYNVNMQFTTTVTQKGQATIPAPIRKKLGIKPNGKISFEINQNNETVIKPVKDFLSLRGSLRSKKPFDIEAMDKAIERQFRKEYGKDAA